MNTVDFDSLKKGDRLGPETLTAAFGVGPEAAEYSRRQVALCEEIRRKLAARGLQVTVACVKAEVRVLDDSEALRHNNRLFKKGRRRLCKAHRQMSAVDTGRLTARERQEHARTLVVQGAILAGVRSATARVYAEPYRRKTPGLVTA
jgi:hypothetical protein